MKLRRKAARTSDYDLAGAIGHLEVLHAKLADVPPPRTIAFAAGKGGVGKTSISANFASMLSASGWRVLVIDLDTQANQSVLFGVEEDDPGLDEGKGLLASVLTGDISHVRPIRDVRPGVDLVPAGVETRKLSDYLATRTQQERRASVRSIIDQLGDGYDLVVIDSRPSGELLGELALLAANYVVIPTKTRRDVLGPRSVDDRRPVRRSGSRRQDPRRGHLRHGPRCCQDPGRNPCAGHKEAGRGPLPSFAP